MVTKFKHFIIEQATSCPIATMDVHVNLANRQHAIDEYGYGPMNPMEKNDEFWQDKADMWNVDKKSAMTSKCENCAAFNISDQMRKCIEKGIEQGQQGTNAMSVIEKADLGYCELLHFKCAGTRTCDLWLTNGPLDNKDIL